MLDDREAKPGSANGARAALVDAVKAFRQAGNMLSGNAGAVIGNADQHPRRIKPGIARRRRRGDFDPAAAFAIFDRVIE